MNKTPRAVELGEYHLSLILSLFGEYPHIFVDIQALNAVEEFNKSRPMASVRQVSAGRVLNDSVILELLRMANRRVANENMFRVFKQSTSSYLFAFRHNKLSSLPSSTIIGLSV